MIVTVVQFGKMYNYYSKYFIGKDEYTNTSYTLSEKV